MEKTRPGWGRGEGGVLLWWCEVGGRRVGARRVGWRIEEVGISFRIGVCGCGSSSNGNTGQTV